MTFLATDSSVQDSRPVEVFAITNTLGVVTRYTSFHRDFSFGGHLYTAKAGLVRGQFAIMTPQNVPEMTLEMPALDPVVAAFAGVGVTPQRWHIAITRVQFATGDSKAIFAGYVRDCQLDRNKAVFTATATTGDAFQQSLPTLMISRLCQHVLFDTRCTVSRLINDIDTTITIDPVNARIVTVGTVGAFAGASDFAFGEILHGPSGERRTIIAQAGLDMTMDLPLPTTAADGDAVIIYRGCARDIDACDTKFSNVQNFGGHPHVVTSNPWFAGLDRSLRSTSE